jgi:PTS system N-acetylglucosamine-specific IIA component
MTLSVIAPVPGRAIDLAAVPDPVFSAGMVGPGRAVDPDRGELTAVAPVAGTVVKAHPHAFVVVTPGGRGVLVHLGIDTVELKGDGFELLVGEGTQVEAGAPIVRWDSAAVEAGGRSPACPVVALDAPGDALELPPAGPVAAGAELFSWL